MPKSNFSFGSFTWVCSRAALSVCGLLDEREPECYARNVSIGKFLIFQPAVIMINIATILLTFMMISNIKSKYTAVGRKEMATFFYSFLAFIVLDIVLLSTPMKQSLAKVPAPANSSPLVPDVCAICFQFFEDGTSKSVWGVRILGLLGFAGAFIAALLAAISKGAASTLILFIVYFIVNGAFIFLFCLMQFILIAKRVRSWWSVGKINAHLCAVGNLVIGLIFLAGVPLSLVFSNQICRFAVHYVDGMFMAHSSGILSVMMVYKYWDSITKEYLEFCVINAPSLWSKEAL